MSEYYTESDLPIVLTVLDVAKLLRVSKNTAYDYLRSGAIPCIRVGHQIRVFRDDALAFLRSDFHTFDAANLQ